MWVPQSVKYDGPMRPFMKRDAMMREGDLPPYHNKGVPVGQSFPDVFPEGADPHIEAALCKHYGGAEMYPTAAARQGGVVMHGHGYPQYHPHGGRQVPPELYARNMYQDPRVDPRLHDPRQHVGVVGRQRYMGGGVPEMMMMNPAGYGRAAGGGGANMVGRKKQMMGMEMGNPGDPRRGMVRGAWDDDRTDSEDGIDARANRNQKPLDEAALQKRKRNRIAQKKYRERKKTETNRVADQLETQKEQLTRMENLNGTLVDEHARNAVLTDMEGTKNREIEALKKMLADLQNIDVVTEATPSSSVMPDAERRLTRAQKLQEEPELEGMAEKTIVMDMVGSKFVEDMFPDVVRDIKTEVHGHVACERRLPLLLNVMQERLLRYPDGPNYSTIFAESQGSSSKPMEDENEDAAETPTEENGTHEKPDTVMSPAEDKASVEQDGAVITASDEKEADQEESTQQLNPMQPEESNAAG